MFQKFPEKVLWDGFEGIFQVTFHKKETALKDEALHSDPDDGELVSVVKEALSHLDHALLDCLGPDSFFCFNMGDFENHRRSTYMRCGILWVVQCSTVIFLVVCMAFSVSMTIGSVFAG